MGPTVSEPEAPTAAPNQKNRDSQMTERMPSDKRLSPTSMEGIQIGGFDEQRPPRPAPPNKGTTKYPFEELQVGQVLYIERSHSAVREALRRFLATHQAMRFEVWRGRAPRGESCVVIKRTS